MIDIVNLEKRIDDGEKFSKHFVKKVIKGCIPTWKKFTSPSELDVNGRDLYTLLENEDGIPRMIQRTIIKLKQATE